MGRIRQTLTFAALIGLAACAPSEQTERAADGGGLFVDVTAEAGLPAPPESWPAGTFHLPEIMHGGLALFDYDADGDLDILQSKLPAPGQADAAAPNALYRRDAQGTYTDVAAQAGIADPGYGQGLVVGDTDADGDLDVYFTNFGEDSFYLNDGDGTFTQATRAAGFAGSRWSTSAAFCDYDRDGDLDLYVAHYVRFDEDTACQDAAGRQEYCSPETFPGEPDKLYRNKGDGTFEDVTEAAGIVMADNGKLAKGLGVVCTDLTGDGWLDFYVANDLEANQLWVSNGDGTFTDQGIVRGVAVNEHGRAEASMGLAVGDINGDAQLDLYMTHLANQHNTLYVGGGGMLFNDHTLESRLGQFDIDLTGFGCAFFDVDNDADLDVAVANGRVTRGEALAGADRGPFWNLYAEPNLLLVNDGTGQFDDASASAGAFASDIEVTRGLAVADIDDDGDLDLVVSNTDNSLRLYRNESARENRWLAVRAMAGPLDALGAQVSVTAAGRTQTQVVLGGYSYVSVGPFVVHFGLGSSDSVESVDVLWPSGRRESFTVEGVNRTITLVEGQGTGP